MSPTLYTKKFMSNAKYWSSSVKCGQVPKWVICTCAEAVEGMWFWPRNVPKVILLTGPKFQFNFSRGSGVFAEKFNAGSPLKIRESHTLIPLYNPCTRPTHPMYARKVNARRKIRGFLGQCGRTDFFLCKI